MSAGRRRKDVELPLSDEMFSDSEEESEPRRSFCTPLRVGLCACLLTVALLLGALTLYLVPGVQFREPHWEVRSLLVDSVDVPALELEGLVAADTRHCPPQDPCGLAEAKGCSKCPDADMWNDGCICKRGVKPNSSGSSASPGTIVQADTSACPLLDKCGVFTGVKCSRCPDDSWVNDGCTCRKPVSTKQFFKGLEGFLGLLGGNASSVVQMRIQVGVEVHNPNILGATTGEGTFHLRYRGTSVGTAKTAPRSIGANSSTLMNISVKVDSLPADVAMQMTQELLDTGSQLSMLVDGQLPARAGLLTVTCGVECDLRVDTSRLPATVFTKKVCKYSYGM